MPGQVLQPAIRKPRAKAKAKAAQRIPREPIARPEKDPDGSGVFLVKNVVLNYRNGEADQPDLVKTIKRSSPKYPVQNPNKFNWVLKYSDDPLRFAHLQGDVWDSARVVTQTYNNARCDACGHTCGVLYIARCYYKRDYCPQSPRQVLNAQELQEIQRLDQTRARWLYDLLLEEGSSDGSRPPAPRKLERDIMYFGQDCAKNLFRSRAAGNGDAAEGGGAGNGHEDITTARNAQFVEVNQIIGEGKAKNWPSARTLDETAVKRNARGACRFAIINATKAQKDSNQQASEAAKCRAKGERLLSEIRDLLPQDYDRKSPTQLVEKAAEVDALFATALHACTLVFAANKAFDDAKGMFRIDLAICGEGSLSEDERLHHQRLKEDASHILLTNDLVTNIEKAGEARDFLQNVGIRYRYFLHNVGM
jgi:hypothetical protein